MNQEKIGKLIAEVRKELGLTQEDIARKLGITSQSVSKWENGINLPDVTLLLDLCEILEINVDELLDGERKKKDYKLLKEKKSCVRNVSKEVKGKNILVLVILILFSVSVGGFILFKYNNEEETFQNVAKDDLLVKNSLEYITFSKSINKNLLQKLYDNNENLVTENDLTNDEKMFLVLNKYKKNHKLDYFFSARSDDLKNVMFEDSSFLDSYIKDGVYHTIQNSINYSCHKGIVYYEELEGVRLDNSGIYFDILVAKKSNSKLVIDFKVAFLYYVDYERVAYYSDVLGHNLVFRQDSKQESSNLNDEFKSFRLNLKIKGDQTYFESLEKLT